MPSLPSGKVTNEPANYFAIGTQSGKDTDATKFYFLKHLDGTGFDTTTTVSSERIGGGGREIGLRYRTKVTADGQYIAYAQPDFAGRVLACALGRDTVVAGPSQGTGNPYYSTHTIVSGSATTLPYQTIEQAWADEIERTSNCLISSCKLEGEAGKPVKITAQFVTGGTPHQQGPAQAAVREASFPIMVPGASVAITASQPSGLLNAASSLQVTKWSVEIKNQLDDNIQTVALNREDVTWLNADYDVEGTFKYVNSAFWNQVIYGGGSQVPTGVLSAGTFTFFSETPSAQSLEIFAPFIEFTGLKVNRLNPDGQTMYIDFVGSTRNIGSNSLQCTVISGASTAYTLSTT